MRRERVSSGGRKSALRKCALEIRKADLRPEFPSRLRPGDRVFKAVNAAGERQANVPETRAVEVVAGRCLASPSSAEFGQRGGVEFALDLHFVKTEGTLAVRCSAYEREPQAYR